MSWTDAIKKPVPVLLVDDDVNDRIIFRHNVRDYHVEIIEASSGEEALRILASRPEIYLIILDEKMTGMSGLETFRKINEDYPQSKVVFLTGYADQYLHQINSIGFAPVLSKPLEHDGPRLPGLMRYMNVPHKPPAASRHD